MATKGKGKGLVVQLPAGTTLDAAKMKPAQLESLVQSLLGHQTGRGVDHVVLKAPASGVAAAKPGGGGWIKTVWTRNC